ELADGAAHLDVMVADGRQPGRVVAPVLQLAQPGDEDGRSFPGTDVPDDSTHGVSDSAVVPPSASRPIGACERPWSALPPTGAAWPSGAAPGARPWPSSRHGCAPGSAPSSPRRTGPASGCPRARPTAPRGPRSGPRG